MSNAEVQKFISELQSARGNDLKFSRRDLEEFATKGGYRPNVVWNTLRECNRVSRGVYELIPAGGNVQPLYPETSPAPQVAQSTRKKVESLSNEDCYVPARQATYVKWGHAKDVQTIISSRMFYPVYVTGLSGNGKTMMIEQACAELKREYIRVQITPETDEDDLIGGFRLINGETIFAKGPVVKAMEAGAILLVDEIDRGSNKLMALQGVLEGKPIMIKKTGEVIVPKAGFNIIATANTKGKGSDDGKFISATIIDEAFLERFTITLEQPYASQGVEQKIIMKHMELFGDVDKDFAVILTKWSMAIRKTYEDGGVDELISTRRLCHIVQTFAIFKDRKKAVELCVSRFDDDTRTAFIDLYTKIDVTASNPTDDTTIVDNYDDDAPF